MTDEEIKSFMKDFETFMDRADVEMKNYFAREAHRKYLQGYYEVEAAKLEVTVDYYMSEFI
tara:strand:- start:324 stop:506 length:183 start_codon:yes stop_codon:yes gene_type:complete